MLSFGFRSKEILSSFLGGQRVLREPDYFGGETLLPWCCHLRCNGALAKTNQTFVEVAKAKVGRYGEVVWVHIGARETMVREEQLGRCLVG